VSGAPFFLYLTTRYARANQNSSSVLFERVSRKIVAECRRFGDINFLFAGIARRQLVVCTENAIRVDDVMESPKLAE